MASTDKTTGSALGKRSFAQCDDRDSDAALQTAQIPSALAQRSDGRHPEGSDIAGAKYQHLNGGGNAAHRSAADGGLTSIAQGQRSRNVVLNVAPQALAALSMYAVAIITECDLTIAQSTKTTSKPLKKL